VKRGDIVLASGRGDFATKPRPALVVQSDVYNDAHGSVSLCPITSVLIGPSFFRLAIEPTDRNGLDRSSEIQIDKIQSVRRTGITDVTGSIELELQDRVDEALRRWLDL